MQIKDLDQETRAVVAIAHMIAERPEDEALLRLLREALKKFDDKHAAERAANLLKNLFARNNAKKA